MQSGEIQKALNKGYEIINYSKKHHQEDKDLADFYGLFGEFLYNVDKREEAVEMLRQGRMYYWIKCRNNGVEIVPTDLNLRNDVMVNADRKKVNEDAIAQFATQIPAASQAKGGKPAADAKKPPAAAKGG